MPELIASWDYGFGVKGGEGDDVGSARLASFSQGMEHMCIGSKFLLEPVLPHVVVIPVKANRGQSGACFGGGRSG